MKAHSLLGIESRGRLVDDNQFRIPEKRLRDAEALPHAAGEGAEVLLPRIVKIGALQQRVDGVASLARVADSLQHRKVIQHRLGRDPWINAELLRQVSEQTAHFVLLAKDVDVAERY